MCATTVHSFGTTSNCLSLSNQPSTLVNCLSLQPTKYTSEFHNYRIENCDFQTGNVKQNVQVWK